LKNKKLTKAETLKAAILYIQHLEELLTVPTNSTNSSPSLNHTSIKSEQFVETEQLIKSEPNVFDQQTHRHQSRQFHSIQQHNSMPSNYPPSLYNSYFNPMSSTNSSLNCQAEYGNENHLLMHYDFNSGRYS
jgi:hypothetical protein